MNINIYIERYLMYVVHFGNLPWFSLFCEAEELVLVDFGLCCPASDAERRTIAGALTISPDGVEDAQFLGTAAEVGSLLYVAPEVFSRRYDAKVGTEKTEKTELRNLRTTLLLYDLHGENG